MYLIVLSFLWMGVHTLMGRGFDADRKRWIDD